MSRQRRDNLGVGERLGELHHAPEVLFGEATSVVGLERTGELCNDAFPIGRLPTSKDLRPNTPTDLPVQHGLTHVHGHRLLEAANGDVSQWSYLSAKAMSADGKTVVGIGTLAGPTTSFIARLP